MHNSVQAMLNAINNERSGLICAVQGLWSVWCLPGSPSFHVMGIAEILGAKGVLSAF